MASISITVQSLLNCALYYPYTLDDTTTVGTFKTTIQTDTGIDPTWYTLSFNNVILADANTLASYSIITGSELRADNIIARLTTLQDRQLAKLNLATLDRTASGDPFNVYDINLLPSQYIGDVSTPNSHPNGLIEGRPWIIPTVYLDANNAEGYSGTGTTWYNTSSSTNNATLVNTPTYNSSPGSFTFVPASKQWAYLPDIGSLSNWTVEVWFYLTATLTGQITAVVCNEFDGASINFSIGTNKAPGSYNLVVGFYASGAWHSTNGFAPSLNTWYQCVGTYDGTTITQYVNGVLNTTLAYADTSASGGEIRIASRWDDQSVATDFFPGKIGIVSIYDRVLTAAQVLSNFDATKATYGL